MNAILNETELWFCDICDKIFIIKSKSKHNTSKTQKHKQKYGNVVEEYEFFTPDFNEKNYILNNSIRDCRKKILSIIRL